MCCAGAASADRGATLGNGSNGWQSTVAKHGTTISQARGPDVHLHHPDVRWVQQQRCQARRSLTGAVLPACLPLALNASCRW